MEVTRSVGGSAGRGGMGSYYIMRSVSVRGDEKVLETESGDGYPTLWM